MSGVSESDLATRGLTQIDFPSSHPPASVSTQDLPAVAANLQRRCGDPLIVSLCSRSGSGSPLAIALTRPVAVRIVRLGTSVSGQLRVTMQPCVMVTSTAVTSEGGHTPVNRYIYSVRLIE